MRTIKFRAWDKSYKHFHEGDLIREYVIGDFIDNPEYEVTQYTGLKDKNGRDIYESDVLKVPDFYESPENTSETYHYETVYFERGSFRTDNGIGDEDWDYISEECEVIGNIYENSDLLKGR